MEKETLHRVIYGLIFPALLSSVFVLFISEDLKDFGFYPRVLFGFIFIFHWTLKFSLAYARHRIVKYSFIKFLEDSILVIGMNLAYHALTNTEDFIKGSFH